VSDDKRPIADFTYEVGGVTVTTSVFVEDVDKILAWSTSEVILYLGSEGPLLQKGLREIFGS
jgi:hypothetical protein